MKKRSTFVLGAAVALLAAGCAYTAPYQSSGPSYSEQGVQVGIAGIRCYVNRESDPMIETGSVDDRLGLDVKLQINNDSDRVAEFEERNIRLSETEIPGAQAAPPRQSKVITVLPGEIKQVRLAFMPEGATDCHHSFALDLTDSVEVDGSPVPLSPIMFEAKQ
jgi:hypothetical protein